MLEQAMVMVKIARLIETLDADKRRAVAYEVYRNYGGPLSDAERASRYRDRMRHENVTEPRDEQEVIPTLVVDASSGSVSSEEKKASKKQVLTQDDLSKAKGLLAAADFEFLQACPEPFRTEWLIDPEWWVSLRDGYPKVDALREASKNMSWLQGKYSPKQMARMNLRERLRRWIAKSDRWRENAEERKAVRR